MSNLHIVDQRLTHGLVGLQGAMQGVEGVFAALESRLTALDGGTAVGVNLNALVARIAALEPPPTVPPSPLFPNQLTNMHGVNSNTLVDGGNWRCENYTSKT